MKLLNIALDDLIFAYQDDSPDNVYYLDTEYGDIRLVNKQLDDLRDLTDEIELGYNRFLYVPKPDKSELLADLRSFANTIGDQDLRSILEVAFDSPHTLQAFRKILANNQLELLRLDKFRREKNHERIVKWLNAHALMLKEEKNDGNLTD